MTYHPPVGVWNTTPIRRALWAVEQARLRVERAIPEQGQVDQWAARIADALVAPVEAYDWEAWFDRVTKDAGDDVPDLDFDEVVDEVQDELWPDAAATRAALEALPHDPEDLDQALKGALEQVKGIPDSTREELQRVMRSVYERESGRASFAREIRAVWSDVAKQRADMIAVTEWNRAASAATIIGYRKTGIEFKRWFNAGDQRVCSYCEANAAEGEVPIDQAFPGGADYPPQHPSCRCNVAAA